MSDVHPSETAAGSQVGHFSVSDDNWDLHLGNQIPPQMKELQKFTVQTAFLCIYINRTVARQLKNASPTATNLK